MGQPVLPSGGFKKKRISTKRNVWQFQVDFSDINKELGVLIKVLGKDLIQELKSKHVAEKVAKRAADSLATQYSPSSGRIRAIMDAVQKNAQYAKYKTSISVGRFKTVNGIKIGVAKLSYLDKMTKISALDRAYPPVHKTSFMGDVKKKIGQESKNRNFLWKILEHREKKSYTIPTTAPGPVVYTSSKDGYSRFHVSRAVTWHGTGRGAFSAYYLLNSAREVYKSDQVLFTKYVASGVAKMIRQRTRFRK